MNAIRKSSTRQDQHRDGLFADPGAIAPSVDKAWRDDLIVELRLLDVPGDRIGDALMTVETHVAESGESAVEAFGDARAYARALVPQAEPGRWPVTPLFLAGNLLGLAGLLITTRAFGGWLDGGPVQVTSGDVASAVVLLTLMAGVTAFFGRLVRAVTDHVWWVFALAFTVLGLLVALPTLLLREPLFDVSPVVLGLVGVALLLVSSVIAYRQAAGDGPDRITAPGQQPKDAGAQAGLLTAVLLPLATLVSIVLTWIPTLFR